MPALLLLLLLGIRRALAADADSAAMASVGRASDKIHTHGYHRFYPSLFAQHGLSNRNATFRMLEIGFGVGGSVALWESLFPNADITWVDYSTPAPEDRRQCAPGANVTCSAGERSRFFFGDQANATFLRDVARELCGAPLSHSPSPCLDVIIDDGGHGYVQQLTSFRVLFETALKP